MNIKCSLFVVAACCLAAGSMSAQSSHARTRAKPAMWAALQLSESQKTQVSAIHDKYAPAVQVVQQRMNDSTSQIHDREMGEVRSILTPEQQQTFDSYMSGSKRTKRMSVGRAMPVKIAVPR